MAKAKLPTVEKEKPYRATVMGRFRKVEVKIWGDARFRELTPIAPSGQSLWLYLLLGPHTGVIPGLYRLGRAGLAEDLSWPLECLDACFDEIITRGMAVVDWSSKVVYLPNGLKHNAPQNPSQVVAWRKEFSLLPECEIVNRAHFDIQAFLSTIGEDYLKAFVGDNTTPPKPTKKPVQDGAQHGVRHGVVDGVQDGVAHGAGDGVKHHEKDVQISGRKEGIDEGQKSPTKQPGSASRVQNNELAKGGETQTTEARWHALDPVAASSSDDHLKDIQHSVTHGVADHTPHSVAHGVAHGVAHQEQEQELYKQQEQELKTFAPNAADAASVPVSKEKTDPKPHNKDKPNQHLAPDFLDDVVTTDDDFVLSPVPYDPPVFTLLMKGGKKFVVTESLVKHYQNLYEAVDVMKQLPHLLEWLETNPSRRSVDEMGIRRQISSWMKKHQRSESTNFGRTYESSPAPISIEASEAFGRFMALYPTSRQGSIARCVSVWNAISPSPDEDPTVEAEIIKGLTNWIRSADWQKEGGKYIMGMERFLLERRWTQQPSSSRHFNLNDDEKWDGADALLGMSLGEVIRQSQKGVEA